MRLAESELFSGAGDGGVQSGVGDGGGDSRAQILSAGKRGGRAAFCAGVARTQRTPCGQSLGHFAEPDAQSPAHGSGTGILVPICNPSWEGDIDHIFGLPDIPAENRVQHFETANSARLISALPVGDPIDNFCPRIWVRFAGGSVLYNTASFVWQPPGIGDASNFDDLLVWHTRGELSAAIRGNIPRLPTMQIAYFGPEFL